MRIHHLTVEEALASLQSGPLGLAASAAARRLAEYGPNVVERVGREPLPLRFFKGFTHFFAIILWLAAGLAFFAEARGPGQGMATLGFAIIGVIVVNGVFSFWQEYRAERALQALQKLLPHEVKVVREGKTALVPAEELVPGDLVVLQEGDNIPADCRVVEAFGLRVNTATVTGESLPHARDAEPCSEAELLHSRNVLLAGTSVVSGEAKALVFATGSRTAFGQIAHLTQATKERPSPLQEEIVRLSRLVALLALGLGVVFYFVGRSIGLTFWANFTFAIGIIVANVPEGLLPTVTLALAMGSQRMAKRNALIRHLPAVETLGATTVICTDKTGTLTLNRMAVQQLFDGERFIHANDAEALQKLKESRRPLFDVAAHCHNLKEAEKDGRRQLVGDPMEVALVEFAQQAEVRRDSVSSGSRGASAARGGPSPTGLFRRKFLFGAAAEPGPPGRGRSPDLAFPRLGEVPFDSQRKRLSTIHQTPEGAVLYTKGAPETVLPCCPAVQIRGEVRPLAPALKGEFLAAQESMAEEGLRVLAFAHRKLALQITQGHFPLTPALSLGEREQHIRRPDDSDASGLGNAPGAALPLPKGEGRGEGERDVTTAWSQHCEEDLILDGLIGLEDPPRPEVPAAIRQCRAAGIKVIMVTGDHPHTAKAIAREIGLVTSPEPVVITGERLARLSDVQLQLALDAPEILFARVAADQKMRIVSVLKQKKEIVAVTGDGVNDAPALKKADVGIAMGINGTDVARESADMILLDDNFASIVAAIEEGRAVFANIRKFLTYILTSNIPELVPYLAFVLFKIPLPLTVIQILAVDLGTDMVPALALGAEPPDPQTMKSPPRSAKERLLNFPLIARAYLWLGPLQAAAAMAAFFFLLGQAGWQYGQALAPRSSLYLQATTACLSAIIVMQVANVFICRSRRQSIFSFGLSHNPLLLWGIGIELTLILLIDYTRWGNVVFGTAPIPLRVWLYVLPFALGMLMLEELRKWWRRSVEKHRELMLMKEAKCA